MNSNYILDETDHKEIEKLLIGRKVIVKDNILLLDNGIELKVIANEGCGGCLSGWYSIENLNNVDNAITRVEFIMNDYDDYDYDDYSYKIFVFCEDTRIKLLQVDGSDGNGYYGTGYEIEVNIPNDLLKKKGDNL